MDYRNGEALLSIGAAPFCKIDKCVDCYFIGEGQEA
jgi:hypothetical protein